MTILADMNQSKNFFQRGNNLAPGKTFFSKTMKQARFRESFQDFKIFKISLKRGIPVLQKIKKKQNEEEKENE